MKIILKILFTLLFATNLMSESDGIVTIDAGKFINKCSYVLHNVQNKSEIIQSDSKRMVFKINSNILEPILVYEPQKIKIENFPISTTEIGNIELDKYDLPFDENTVWLRNTKAGVKKGETPKFNIYCGRIEAEEKSKVYFGYSDSKLYCMLERSSGEKYFIIPSLKTDNNKIPHFMVASSYTYEKSDLMPFICFTKDYMNIPSENELRKKYKDKTQSEKMLQLEIALEASNDYFQMFGTYERASAYMTAVMAIVSKIYLEQLNVKIHIPYVQIYEDSTNDPYASKSGVAQKLYKMPGVWKSRSNVNRTIACLFAALHPDGNGYYTAGISMGINTLCSKQSGYCVFGINGSSALPTMNYVSDVSVSAHEIGHACGGPHTHSCYFEPNMIDTCITAHLPYESDGCVENGSPIPRPGTIMSYCHLTNSTRSVQYIFGDRMMPLLRNALDNANCISEVQQPYIALLNPSGDKGLKSGDKEEIIWTSTLINLVSIKYSTDNGSSWNIIASGKPATDKSYLWTVPSINSDKVLIVIYDMVNTNTADTVLRPFSIHTPLLSINGPTNGQRFGQREKYNITWENLFIDSVRIQFSSNGGSTWSNVVSSVRGNIYQWELPRVISINCKIKVESLTEDKLVSESENFAIGISSAKLLSPNGGEKLCVGNEFEIRWESDYLNDMWLEYSVDYGAIWRRVSLGIVNATAGKYLWKVPNRISDSCIIRIYQQFDKNMILDLSDSVFTIDSCLSDVYDEFHNSGLKILDLIPNPVNDEANISIINNTKNGKFSLSLFDYLGREIYKFGEYENSDYKKITIKVKFPDLPQGNYLIKAASGNYIDIYKVKIIK